MDKKTFDEEIFDHLEPHPLSMTLESLREIKKQYINAYTSGLMSQPTPDNLMVQAAMGASLDSGEHAYLDAIVPQFRQRLLQYRNLQSFLIQDLVTMQKAAAKNLSLFRQYL